jgi:hypothetical protein
MHGLITAILAGLVIGLIADVSDLRCRLDGYDGYSMMVDAKRCLGEKRP